ncbi:hypothetical protein Y1Q_0006816 [Alligator mississippiensis]|uniref:Uncharacterized protein n=1 Tax=Alligator mississippiensis TaxID=8496 RepID=A0A151M5U3_ALLMI|nr:hypothetical protein Y1Q_0006816 [Alligator mississippiensis]
MEDIVCCNNELMPTDILRKKNELERNGMMTEGLATSISRALELVVDLRQDRKTNWYSGNIQLVVQADGCWLEFKAGAAKFTVLVWYDQYKKEVKVLKTF